MTQYIQTYTQRDTLQYTAIFNYVTSSTAQANQHHFLCCQNAFIYESQQGWDHISGKSIEDARFPNRKQPKGSRNTDALRETDESRLLLGTIKIEQ